MSSNLFISKPDFSELDLVMHYFSQIASNQASRIMLDVGAHIGSSALPFLRAGWKVHCFEPEPYNFAKLEQNTQAHSNITLNNKAVSTSGESITLYQSEDHWGIHSVQPFHDSHTDQIEVESIQLDEYIQEHQLADVDFLKVDTEGGDFDVLKSLSLENHAPTMVMIEFMDSRSSEHFGYTFRDVISYMSDFGYQALVFGYDEITEYGREDQPSGGSELLYAYVHEEGNDEYHPYWGNIIFYKENNEPFIQLLQQLRTRSNQKMSLEQSAERMKQFKNIHQGERCVIIGNGPSLKDMDLSFLEEEFSFGLNKIYLIFDQWDFRPSYFASVNPLVLKQNNEAIIEHIEGPKFVSQAGLEYFDSDIDDLYFLKNAPFHVFSTDLTRGMAEGYTVTFVAMQIAYYMGFDEVVLIGVDHSFATDGDPNKKVVSDGKDPNHFHPDYFGEGVEWHLPDLENSERYYRMAKYAFEREGCRILDATVDGQLDIFPKVDYQEHFANDQVPARSAPIPAEQQAQQAVAYLEDGLILEAINIFSHLIDQELLTREAIFERVEPFVQKAPQQHKLLIELLRHRYGSHPTLDKWAQSGQQPNIDQTVGQLNQLIQAGELDQAEKFINQLLSQITDHAGLWMSYAVLHVQRNNIAKAQQGLERVLQLQPDHQQARQLHQKIQDILN